MTHTYPVQFRQRGLGLAKGLPNLATANFQIAKLGHAKRSLESTLTPRKGAHSPKICTLSLSSIPPILAGVYPLCLEGKCSQSRCIRKIVLMNFKHQSY